MFFSVLVIELKRVPQNFARVGGKNMPLFLFSKFWF